MAKHFDLRILNAATQIENAIPMILWFRKICGTHEIFIQIIHFEKQKGNDFLLRSGPLNLPHDAVSIDYFHLLNVEEKNSIDH